MQDQQRTSEILTGNADLADSCQWTPPATTERAPLPGCAHFDALDSIELS